MRFGPLGNGDGIMADLLRPGVGSARGDFGVTGLVRWPNDLRGDAICVWWEEWVKNRKLVFRSWLGWAEVEVVRVVLQDGRSTRT